MASVNQVSKIAASQTVANSGRLAARNSNRVWHFIKSGLHAIAEQNTAKKQADGKGIAPAIEPDLLQCRHDSEVAVAGWSQILTQPFALLNAASRLNAEDIKHIALACQKNGLQLVCLVTQSDSSIAAKQLDYAALTTEDWLALHQLASLLLQPAEIRATHLGISLSAAEVFCKPALQASCHTDAATSHNKSHPLCTISSWITPDLPQLFLQIRDHFKVIAQSAELSRQRLHEIMLAEAGSANYQHWYGDILTGKHIAP